MKKCLFCREDIQPDAIKCSHCASLQVPIPPDEPVRRPEASGRTTFIVDNDLITFAKFAAATITVFLVIGAYLFGVKMETLLERVRDTESEVAKSQQLLDGAQKDLELAKTNVRRMTQEVQTVLGEARSTLLLIRASKDEAAAYVVSIKELSPGESAVLQRVRQEQPGKFKGGTKYWTSGTVLRIRYLDGDASNRDLVTAMANRWARYANISFRVVESGMAEVRVSFKQAGAWAFRGTDALAVPEHEPTVNFQWVDQRTALHELGHVLGLIEEQLNPRAKISWNKELIYREQSGPPNFWTRQQIDAHLFTPVPASDLGTYRDFDPQSIMMTAFPAHWTNSFKSQGGNDLSESDKALVARIYPKNR